MRGTPISEETAMMILCIAAAVGMLVWLLGVWFLSRSRAVRAAALTGGGDSGEGSAFHSQELSEAGRTGATTVISGRTELDGAPDSLIAKATHAIAVGGLGGMGQLRIVSRTEDRLVFEGVIHRDGKRNHGPRAFRGGFRFTAIDSARTRAEYLLEIPSGRWVLILGRGFLCLGLVALVGGFWALSTFVAHNENPHIRGQVFQMMQAVHFLWPPFLFGFLYRRWGERLRAAVETTLQNLPYVQVEG